MVELMTQVEMLRLFILKTSWEMDRIVAECQSSKALQYEQSQHLHLCHQLDHWELNSLIISQ
jgi:hypothetical protein